MNNYIMIDGKKIEISEDTANNILKGINKKPEWNIVDKTKIQKETGDIWLENLCNDIRLCYKGESDSWAILCITDGKLIRYHINDPLNLIETDNVGRIIEEK